MRVNFSIDMNDVDTLNASMLKGVWEEPWSLWEWMYYYSCEVTDQTYTLLSHMNIIHDLAVVDEEAERAKFKLNMPTKDVQCSIGATWKVECSLNNYIEQIVTEQVMKVLNSVEYQSRALNALYPELFSEHQQPLNTEQKKD